MDKVEFGGLLIYYTIPPPSRSDNYADAHIRFIVDKEKAAALAKFLDVCKETKKLDDVRTSFDKFTITIDEKD